MLNSNDLDLGSGSPALLPGGLVWIGRQGRDPARAQPRGARRAPAGHARPQTGGEVQTLPARAAQQMFTRAGRLAQTSLYVADGGGTAAYRVSARGLQPIWQNRRPERARSSPEACSTSIPGRRRDRRLRADQRTRRRELPAPSGHWNSPIVVDGHVIEPDRRRQRPPAERLAVDLLDALTPARRGPEPLRRPQPQPACAAACRPPIGARNSSVYGAASRSSAPSDARR